MNGSLRLHNRQRARTVDRRFLRRIVHTLLVDELQLEGFAVVISLLNDATMSELNETWLNHEGSTDVLTFDYRGANIGEPLAGEIFVCVEEAVRQAQAYHTTWQAEVVRYIVHGILHLQGYDDMTAPKRRIMKRQENRLLKRMALNYRLNRIAGRSQ